MTAKPQGNRLNFVANVTLGLLFALGAWSVLSIFDATLDWNLFGPKVKALLNGVFYSLLSLSVIGVALTLTLGMWEVAHSFRTLLADRTGEGAGEISRAAQLKWIIGGITALAMTIGVLALANQSVLRHRSGVFKRLAGEQMRHFEPKLASALAGVDPVAKQKLPQKVEDLMRTLNELSFVSRTVIYLPDPTDAAALWRCKGYDYSASRRDVKRIFVAKKIEKAVAKALAGDATDLEALNAEPDFNLCLPVRDASKKIVAVLKIEGNKRENFREYKFGS